MSWNADGLKICIVYEDGAVIVGSVDGEHRYTFTNGPFLLYLYFFISNLNYYIILLNYYNFLKKQQSHQNVDVCCFII